MVGDIYCNFCWPQTAFGVWARNIAPRLMQRKEREKKNDTRQRDDNAHGQFFSAEMSHLNAADNNRMYASHCVQYDRERCTRHRRDINIQIHRQIALSDIAFNWSRFASGILSSALANDDAQMQCVCLCVCLSCAGSKEPIIINSIINAPSNDGFPKYYKQFDFRHRSMHSVVCCLRVPVWLTCFNMVDMRKNVWINAALSEDQMSRFDMCSWTWRR